MYRLWREAALLISLAMGTAGPGFAQSLPAQPPAARSPFFNEDDTPAVPPAQPAPARKQKKTTVFEHDPDLDASDQLSPSQIDTSMPGAVAMPPGGSHTHAAARATGSMLEGGAPAARPARVAQPHVIACSGLFGPDSSHAKLASAFHAKNVGFSQVDSSSGAKIPATVLFAKDPRQRLEVWWSNPASRSATHLIVINGQSDWIAPGELHLGLTLAELEQLNGKPFKLSGFDKNNVATLTDWNGGQLSAPAGGCKVGISLRAEPRTGASELPADRAYSSNDAALRAVNPTVSEILIAY